MTLKSEPPVMHTRTSLAQAFRLAGLYSGMHVLVHSSMKTIGGWICGGAETVVHALMDVITPDGTLMMPTFTNNNTEPRYWQRPPVPAEWWPAIRAETPAYDPRTSISRQMGAIPESFRQFEHVQRSAHPILSFAAWGQHAQHLLSPYPLEEGFGNVSPLGRLYDMGGAIFMLGTGHANNTSMHLAEHRTIRSKVMVSEGCAMLVNGQRQWVEFTEIDYDDGPFELIGRAYEEAYHPIVYGRVGQANTRLMPIRSLVDFTVSWMDDRSQQSA